MKEKNDVEVLINGRKYTICGFESAEYLQRVATYINSKYAEFREKSNYRTLDVELRNILLAINIADDYFKADKEKESMRQDNENKDKLVLDMKHEVMESESRIEELSGQNAEYQERIEKAEKEIVAWNVKYQETVSKVASLEGRLEKANRESREQLSHIEELQKKAAGMASEKQKLEQSVQEKSGELKALETRHAELKKQHSAKITKMKAEKAALEEKLKKQYESEKAALEEELKAKYGGEKLDETEQENKELRAKLEAAERRITGLESKNRRGKR